jgi:pyridoxal phosphate enzyme (YggS family)
MRRPGHCAGPLLFWRQVLSLLAQVLSLLAQVLLAPGVRCYETAMSTIALSTGLSAVRAEIERACREASRDPAEVTLVAVSKTFDADAIRPVIDAGQRVFGENRVQEAKATWPALTARHPGVELHMIGPLQSNKAKEAVALFDAIHSVDRPSICEALAKEIEKQGRSPTLFVQINTGEEAQKAGIAPSEADAFIATCTKDFGLTISGLMCIPPLEDAPAPHFALTAKIAARNGLKLLSMGMSADFAAAIQMGATHVRVGSAIFGHRTKPI